LRPNACEFFAMLGHVAQNVLRLTCRSLQAIQLRKK
jgi:hypothetical protein